MVIAIHRIALALGLQTIGEWVESEATLEALRSIGVHFAQGFAIGEPTPLT
jgi:EAL domain-containing protein (putative c-di-GMP-specific phosphodiesterase class I)